MKALLFIFLSLMFLGIQSCGNPNVTDDDIPILSGDDDFSPDPDDPKDPTEPDPADPKDVVLTFAPRKVGKSEYKTLELPYRTMFFKVLGPGESKKHIACKKKFKKKCVVNKQVLFAFDTDAFKEYKEHYKLMRIKLKADYVSFGKNRRSEMICFVNDQVCSGRAITKIPGIGLPDLAKLAFWNGPFWKRGPASIVQNDIFHSFLESGWSEDDGVFLKTNETFRLDRLFGQDNLRFQQHLFDDTPLYFTVTDDTFVENVEIEIFLREKL